MSPKAELRLTDTNAGVRFQRPHLGIGRRSLWWLVGGIGAGITLFFVFLVILSLSLTVSFVVALVPLLICLAYISGCGRANRPATTRTVLNISCPAGFVLTPDVPIHFMSHKKEITHIQTIWRVG